ncbi:MAG TPA: AAA family ATPase [Halanaerobiales bacterium]|nr:AAA family ATPase [Halanaerobiales bacterium]
MARKIAIVNQKGGVGKSTTAINLGASIAESDREVLIVDVDPQGNATSGLGLEKGDLKNSIYDALINDTDLNEIIQPTGHDNFYILPANIDLAGAEIELVSVMSRESRLKKKIEESDIEFDYIIFDCPPSLGLLTLNALTASDFLIVPIQCEYYALEGLGQLMQTIELVQSNLNPDLSLLGVVLTMNDARTNLSSQVIEEVKKYFGKDVFDTIIPRNVRLSEAPSFGKPIVTYAPSSRGAKAYKELAKEVIERE